MLRDLRAALRPGGRAATLVIEIAPGLDARTRRRARADGPPHAATRSTYRSMHRTAGFVDVEAIDLTGEYRATAAAWLRERERRANEYRALVGDDVAAEQAGNGATAVRAIDAGLLRRTLYVARRR